MRFTVPVRTVHAGYNGRYFGNERGVTFYNYVSDQFSGFHAQVIPGTLRDSLFILDGLLEQQTSLKPIDIMSDTAGYSDVMFGLFHLLGYQFSPRLADISGARFWRIDPGADHLEAAEGPAALQNVERLSPVSHEHINFLGRYRFDLAEEVARGDMRALARPESSQRSA